MTGQDGRQLRILLAKVSMDGHDRGIRMIAKWLTNAGMEVIYLGPYQTAETVVATAIQDDVDVIGLSFLGGEHLLHSRKVLEKMSAAGLTDVPLVVGGVIPKQDIAPLKDMGVAEVFVAGTLMERIVGYLQRCRQRIAV
jgi:methylmalonyl-CoA mutase C-terminal domain/subunit